MVSMRVKCCIGIGCGTLWFVLSTGVHATPLAGLPAGALAQADPTTPVQDPATPIQDPAAQPLDQSPASESEADPAQPTFSEAEPGTLDLRTGGEAPAEAPTTPGASESTSEPEVLVAEVVIEGTDDPELVNTVYDAIQTQAGNVTTRSRLQTDIDAVFATGFFADVRAIPSDTPLGVRVTFEVQPNPVIQAIDTEGATVLDASVVDELFGDQVGRVLNFGDLEFAVQDLEAWYADNGYVLGKVVDVRSTEAGQVTLQLAEGEIEDIRIEGNNQTRDFIITRELVSQPGQVFNRDEIQRDVEAVFNLNLFQDVNVALDPGENPEKVVVVVNVEEKRTGSLGATAGISSSTGVFGGVSVSEQNLGGNNQNVGVNVQVGTEETLFDINFTDPRIASIETPTSYNVNIANRQSFSFVFDEGIGLPNGRSVRINRLGGGTTFSRPIGNNWRASLGGQIQFVDATDGDGEQFLYDQLGNPITFSDSGQDSYTTLRMGLVNDSRNNRLNPTSGQLFRVSSEQSVAIFENGLNANRIETTYSTFIPIEVLRTRTDSPEVLAFDFRAGTVLGDLAPYDAFPIGGSDSVRGFFQGAIGSGRSYAQTTTELRFPLFSAVGGVLFADYGSDLGSGSAVAGNPGLLRGKPGDGGSIGAGLRVQSPLGPLRIDYGYPIIGDGDQQGQLHFGIGEKF